MMQIIYTKVIGLQLQITGHTRMHARTWKTQSEGERERDWGRKEEMDVKERQNERTKEKEKT